MTVDEVLDKLVETGTPFGVAQGDVGLMHPGWGDLNSA